MVPHWINVGGECEYDCFACVKWVRARIFRVDVLSDDAFNVYIAHDGYEQIVRFPADSDMIRPDSAPLVDTSPAPKRRRGRPPKQSAA